MENNTCFLFRFTKANVIHTSFRIFSGPDKEHLAYCGYVTLRNEEWKAFRQLIEQGTTSQTEHQPNVYVTEADDFFEDMKKMTEEGFIEVGDK